MGHFSSSEIIKMVMGFWITGCELWLKSEKNHETPFIYVLAPHGLKINMVFLEFFFANGDSVIYR